MSEHLLTELLEDLQQEEKKNAKNLVQFIEAPVNSLDPKACELVNDLNLLTNTFQRHTGGKFCRRLYVYTDYFRSYTIINDARPTRINPRVNYFLNIGANFPSL